DQNLMQASRHGVLEWREAAAVNINIAEGLSGRFLVHADGADRRLAENGRSHQVVVQLAVFLLAKQPARDDLALGEGDGCQGQFVDHIADSVNVGDAAGVVIIDHNGALVVEFNAHVLQPDAFGVRLSAGGKQDGVDLQLGTVAETDCQRASVFADGGSFGGRQDFGIALQLQRECRGNLRVESTQDRWTAVTHGHLDAQTGQDAGKLYRDVAAAHDQDGFWQLFQRKHVVGIQGQFHAGNVGHEGPAAGGHQNLPCGEAPLLHLDGVCVDNDSPGVVNGHAGVFQQGAVDVVEPGDLDILAVAQPVPVQLRCCRDFPAVTGGVMEVLGIMGGIAEQLFGDAADVD